MANFIGPIETTSGHQLFINADLVTGFLYDKEDNVTLVAFVGNEESYEYPGDLTNLFLNAEIQIDVEKPDHSLHSFDEQRGHMRLNDGQYE